jgi:hypothetical protein
VEFGIGGIGNCPLRAVAVRAVEVAHDHGVELRVVLLDAANVEVRQIARRDLARPQVG